MQETIEELKKGFPEADFVFREASLQENIPIFVVRLPDEQRLSKNWKFISSKIAAHYQSSLDQDHDFERWNIYIFFLLASGVQRQLQGTIEQDKFAARKIVIPNAEPNVDVEALISRYVTGADLIAEINGSGAKTDKITMRSAIASKPLKTSENFSDAFGSKLKAAIGDQRFVERHAKNRREIEDYLLVIEKAFLKKGKR